MSTQSDYSVSLIKLLRKHLGFTQAQLSAASQLSPHVMANLESRRKAELSVDELSAIADALGVSPSALLGKPLESDRLWLGTRTWDALTTEVLSQEATR